MDIADVRKQFPQYADMSDGELASALHKKFYSDIPAQEFATKIGLTPKPQEPKQEQFSALDAASISAGHWLDKKAAGLRGAVRDYVPGGESIVAGADWLDRKMGVQPPDDAQYREKQLTGLITGDSRSEADKRMAPVREQQPVASFVGGALPDLAVINPAYMALMAAIDPGSVKDRATNAGLTYGLGKVGQYGGEKLAQGLANRAARKETQLAADKVQNTSRDATVAAAKEAGYVFPPASIAPTTTNRILEGLSGKASTAQGAAVKNEAVTLALAKRDLGFPDSVPVTKETLSKAREVAGTAYEQLKGFGKIHADDDFARALQGTTAEYRALVTDFPELANGKIESLVQTLSKPEFNSASAVELVKRLRRDARANYKAFDDPERLALAKVQDGAHKAIEDLMERNLAATGNEGFLDVFRKARTMIAKTHTIEDALEESTGKIVAKKIKGGHLTGGLATIAKTQEAFPKALQNMNTSNLGMSPLDFLAGMVGGSAAGPTGLAAAAARPVARAGLLSGPYQKAMVNPQKYDLGAAEKMLARFGSDPEKLKRLGGLLGVSGLQAYQ